MNAGELQLTGVSRQLATPPAEILAALPELDGTTTMHFVLFRTASGTAFRDLAISSSTRAASFISRPGFTWPPDAALASELATSKNGTALFKENDTRQVIIFVASIPATTSWLASELDWLGPGEA